jgi:trk system potassium uptake protein TrkA
MAKKKLVFIIGGGKTGSYLASLLLKSCDVRVLENRPQIYEKLAKELPSSAVVFGDGTDPILLEQIGIARADVVAAVTGDDETNLVTASLAKFEYQVERVIVRVNNPRNAWLCTPEMGVDVALSQAEYMASLIIEESAVSVMQTLAHLRRGEVEVIEHIITPTSSAVNRSLSALGLPPGCNVAAVVRGADIVIPDGSTVLQSGDQVLVVTHADTREALQKALE